MFIRVLISVTLFTACVFSNGANAEQSAINFLSASPIGSWQLREQVSTSHKGKKTGATMKMSMVGKEQRNGQTHYWVEMAMQNFKISKKGKRKNKGKRVLMKSLMPESQFKLDPENVLSNVRNFAVETIVQTGNEDPMRMPNSGGMLAGAMKVANVEIQFDFEPMGKETVTVPAGSFNAHKARGTGSTEVNAIIKKFKVQSDMINWYSNDVPFGLVKMEGTTTTNGKVSKEITELLEYAKTGAVSEITKPVKDMPKTPGLEGLFGGH